MKGFIAKSFNGFKSVTKHTSPSNTRIVLRSFFEVPAWCSFNKVVKNCLKHIS